MASTRSALVWACLCAGTVLLWQSLTVRYNYHGNWTALFCSGSNFKTPPELASEHIYQFANSDGYDGQFYHYMAHDPLLRRGIERYIDVPALRARRILIPALAWLAVAGSAAWIDTAYRTWVLVFMFLGAWWLGRSLISYGRHPAWSLCFALTPGALASMDRMTVDVALAALCVGFVLYAELEPSWRIYAVLMLAPLARETGILLAAAFFIAMVLKRRWRAAAITAATAVPTVAWTAFLQWRGFGHTGSPTDFIPFHALLERTVSPLQFARPGRWMMLAAATDYIAVLGIWIALIATAWLLVKHVPGPIELAAGILALMAVFLSYPGTWVETYAFARIFTPLLILLGLAGAARKAWWLMAPALLMLPRLGIQLGGQIPGVAAGLLG